MPHRAQRIDFEKMENMQIIHDDDFVHDENRTPKKCDFPKLTVKSFKKLHALRIDKNLQFLA